MMFRTAELGQSIPKAEFKQKVPVLRRELLETQQRVLKLKKCPVIVVFAGVNGCLLYTSDAADDQGLVLLWVGGG